jgi:hypothetical protein
MTLLSGLVRVTASSPVDTGRKSRCASWRRSPWSLLLIPWPLFQESTYVHDSVAHSERAYECSAFNTLPGGLGAASQWVTRLAMSFDAGIVVYSTV